MLHQDNPGTQLLALTLARALNHEFPNTRRICLGHPTNTVLISELAETETLIDDLLRQVIILKSHMRPINRIPPEILMHIFHFLGAGAFVVPASHVCQKWRHIALSTPSLWSVIREDDNPSAARRFSARSRNLPLDLSFRIFMREGGFAAFRAFVAPLAPRITHLHVHVIGDRVFDFYRSLASKRSLVMPALEHFSIRMSEYGFQDDSHDCILPPFSKSAECLSQLTFRSALPLQSHLSPAIRSLTLAERVFDLDALLACLEAVPNLEYLALLNSVPHTYESVPRSVVTLSRLRELHWFQVWVIDNLLGTVKLFEHLDMPALDTTQFVLLLDPRKYSTMDLYLPTHRHVSLFSNTGHTITELQLEASHFTPGKPARNNIVIHGLQSSGDHDHDHDRGSETVFSVRVNRGSLTSFFTPSGIALFSSAHVSLAHLTHLTLTSAFPYAWSRFFRASWPSFFRSVPTVKVLRLHVSNPMEVIAAIAAADELSLSSSSSSSSSPSASPTPALGATRILPQLHTLHLFRCSRSPRANTNTDPDASLDTRTGTGTGTGTAAVESTNTNTWYKDGNDNDNEDESGQILIRFLRRRADTGLPLQSIVCSPEDAAALPTEAVALVGSIEPGLPGAWAESTFPRRIIPLLEEHLD
ncbi:hypothetical protein BC827DRAFT_528114 [Russula dissimulans]|nr:hypothetical protein BC827DRAFT_528114 [Russula dissimulans]